jgi:hypothetical protein
MTENIGGLEAAWILACRASIFELKMDSRIRGNDG